MNVTCVSPPLIATPIIGSDKPTTPKPSLPIPTPTKLLKNCGTTFVNTLVYNELLFFSHLFNISFYI